MNEEKYQGWNNYATWRIQLEIVDEYVDYEYSENKGEAFEQGVSDVASMLKDYVTEHVTGSWNENENPELSLAMDYAEAFLNDVDWYELANDAQRRKEDYK